MCAKRGECLEIVCKCAFAAKHDEDEKNRLQSLRSRDQVLASRDW